MPYRCQKGRDFTFHPLVRSQSTTANNRESQPLIPGHTGLLSLSSEQARDTVDCPDHCLKGTPRGPMYAHGLQTAFLKTSARIFALESKSGSSEPSQPLLPKYSVASNPSPEVYFQQHATTDTCHGSGPRSSRHRQSVRLQREWYISASRLRDSWSRC